MDRDIRTYFLFIGLPASIITAAGLLTLVFGVSGLSEEVRSSALDMQIERYERNVKSRMATRLKSYMKDGKADHVWRGATLPWGTNVPPRVKYGVYCPTGGTAIGWARVDGDTVIGCDMPPFKPEDRTTLYLIILGTVMVTLLFFTLFAGGWLLARAAKRARDDLETKNSFLDLMSHELNTPLGSIVPLSAALAAGGIRDEARRREALSVISRESARMARMVAELLTAVRLKNGKLGFARERFDLREVAEHAVSMARIRYPDIAIMTDRGSPLFAFADKDKTEQMVANLIDNACKYAGDGDIEVRCREAGGRVRAEVADRGAGMPEAEMKRVFERFYQASPDGSGNGLGLGLNIVAGFAAGMGGAAGAEPREGGGCVFYVELPGCGSAGEGGSHG